MAKNKIVSFPEEQFNTLCNMFQLMTVAGLRFHATGSAIPTDEQTKDIWRTLSRAALGHPSPNKTTKELRYTNPNQEHPLQFKLKDLVVNPDPDTEMEAYLEWQDESCGSRVPCLVIQSKNNL